MICRSFATWIADRFDGSGKVGHGFVAKRVLTSNDRWAEAYVRAFGMDSSQLLDRGTL